MVTNAYGVSSFAIIRSVEATTDPALGVNGALLSGTEDFSISNTGAATFAGAVTANALTSITNINASGDVGTGAGSLYSVNLSTHSVGTQAGAAFYGKVSGVSGSKVAFPMGYKSTT